MPDWWARSDALRDVLVEIGSMPPAQRKFDLAEIQPGWHVFDRDLVPVGRVEAVIGRYVTVRRSRWGVFLWERLYVPDTAIGETHEGARLLNVPRAWIGDMGWGRPPRKPPDPSTSV
ncbi:MAG TPA: hypothetical protein VIK06_01730 [Candidatus Limnocylindrales bacterium]